MKYRKEERLEIALKAILILGGVIALLVNLLACSGNQMNKHVLSDSNNNIVCVNIVGNIDEMNEKSDVREVELSITNAEGIIESWPVQMKIQGSSSLAYKKKNYNVTFYEDDTYSKKQKVDVGLGLGAQNKWTLKADAIDKSHSRNVVSARIARDINKKYGTLKNSMNYGVIDGIPVEFYNNGEFWGIYTFNIAKGDWLWGIDDSIHGEVVIQAKNWTEATAFNGEITDLTEDEGWDHEEGLYDEETIKNLNEMIKFIRDSSDKEFKERFNEYLDFDAALNYLVMLHLFAGIDNTNKNIMMVTVDNGQKWTPSLYDMDTTWGTYWDGTLIDYDFLPYYETDFDSTHPMMISNLWRRMIDNFPEELSARWFALREDILSQNSLIKYFDDFEKSIGEDGFKKDSERWQNQPGYMFDQIKEFIDYRLPFIDNYMDSLAEH